MQETGETRWTHLKKSFKKDTKIIYSTSTNSSTFNFPSTQISFGTKNNHPSLNMTITNSTFPRKIVPFFEFSGWWERIMESHSYLADKLSYYRLQFLSKSTALKLLNFAEGESDDIQEQRKPFSLLFFSPLPSPPPPTPFTLWEVI